MSGGFDTVELEFSDLQLNIDKWQSYTFNSDFLTPTDGFSFTTGDDKITGTLDGRLQCGQHVRLLINGLAQGDGYIDSIDYATSRSSGTMLTVEGRDIMGAVVDSCVDPHIHFVPDMTLEDVISTVLTPYGFKNFVYDSDADRTLRAGNLGSFKTPKTTQKGKPSKRTCKSFYKPHQHEGAYEFCDRLAKRFGLHIRPSVDGTTAILARPSFDAKPSYIIRRTSAETNILSGHVRRSTAGQPSVIVATGFGGGGERDASTMRVVMMNEFTAVDINGNVRPDVQKILDDERKRGAVILANRAFPNSAFFQSPVARPAYVHDEDSRTPKQLEFFVRRKMAEYQKHALKATYTVEDHSQKGVVWTPDTMVDVVDEVSRISEPMWISGRTFKKDRRSGTTTTIDLIRPRTLEFWDADPSAVDE